MKTHTNTFLFNYHNYFEKLSNIFYIFKILFFLKLKKNKILFF